MQGKVKDNPKLSSDLQTHTVCRTHAHIHTHKYPCVHIHTNMDKHKWKPRLGLTGRRKGMSWKGGRAGVEKGSGARETDGDKAYGTNT